MTFVILAFPCLGCLLTAKKKNENDEKNEGELERECYKMHFRDFGVERKIYENSRILSSHSAPLSCSMCDEISIKQLSQLKSIKWNDTNTYRELCCAVIFHFTTHSLPLSAHTENESLTVLD
jgi:hypothetical protein